MKYQLELTLATPKVDTLKHISDHGLTVEFDDSRKGLMEQLRDVSFGKIRIEAGTSCLTVWRAGEVTLTDLRLSRHAEMVLPKYAEFGLSSHARLRELGAHGFGVSLHGAYNSLAWQVLCRVCMGRPLESLLAPTSGAEADILHQWLKRSGWVLLGESGFRSFGLTQQRAEAKSKVASAESALHYATREAERLGRARTEDAKFGLENAIGEKERVLEKLGYDLKTLSTTAPEIGQTDEEWIASIQKACGYELMRNYNERGGFHMPKKSAQWSHDIATPNYAASLEGDRVKLSSGIVCGASASDLLAWLKGESKPLRTRYGTMERMDGRTDSGDPISLIKCGCHLVDPSNLGQEWADVMRPTHAIHHVPEVPALYWQEQQDEIRDRLKTAKLSQIEQTRKTLAKRILDRRKELMDAILWDRPESIERRKAESEAQLSTMRDGIAALKLDLDKFPDVCPLETANANAMAFLNTLTVRR